MSVKNVLNCGAKKVGNTGFGNCVVDIGFIGAIWFAPDNFKLPITSIADAITSIQAAILADVPSQRLYPVPGLVQPTDTSENIKIQTFADGSKAVVLDVFYDWTFQFRNGAFCLSYRLRMANGQNRSFFIIDKNGRVYGTDTGDGMVTAIKPTLAWTNAFKLNTGAAVTEYSTQVNFDSTLINDYPAFLDFSLNGGYGFLRNLMGLQDVNLTKVARTTNVLRVSAMTSCDTVDLSSIYSTQLAVVGAWDAFADNAGVPGNNLTITTVTFDANTKAFVLTIDTSDPDYVAGAPIWVKMKGPTELAALLVSGYESNEISITV